MVATSERGNVLFLILIAVVLFAALSYAVTHSSRSGGSDASNEQTALLASQIVQSISTMQNTVTRMVLSRHVYEYDDIVFAVPNSGDENAGWGSANGHVDFCTSGQDCIFAPEGGRLVLNLPRDAFDMNDASEGSVINWGINGYNGFWTSTYNSAGDGGACFSWNNAMTVACDDAFIIRPLKPEICNAINRKLGITVTQTDRSAVDWIQGHIECTMRIGASTTGGDNGELVFILKAR